MLGLVIGDLGEKPVSPQERGVLADAAVLSRSAYRQATSKGLGVVLPEVTLAQPSHRCPGERVAGFATGLAAVAWQTTAGAPGS
ncbi:hypothetical protein D9M71_594930 [compost metagenome]